MKVVILAGGYGTRISEESYLKPKPMIEIGGMPILWHIMKNFSEQGFNDFIICAGYKQELIKQWFANYYTYTSDVFFDFEKPNSITLLNNTKESWKVAVVNTGLNTNTAGRIKQIKKYLDNDDFIVTYGDGVADIDIKALVHKHNEGKKNHLITISRYNYKQHKGIMQVDDNDNVISFREKSETDSELINIGYMVCSPKILSYITSDSMSLEMDVIEKLCQENKVYSYLHTGFWQCMDTLREKNQLEDLWNSGKALWKIW